MASEYTMRGYKTSSPAKYVYWTSVGSADLVGTYSGYDPSELTSIAVDYVTSPDQVPVLTPIDALAAGGDLSGIYPNPVVIALQSNPVSSTAPADGELLTWNSAALPFPTWEPAPPPSGTSAAGSDTYVQFNDATAFGGDAGLTYNKTTNLLSLSDAIAIGGTPATAGMVRLPGSNLINMRSFDDTVNTTAMSKDTTTGADYLFVGFDGSGGGFATPMNSIVTGASTNLFYNIGGTTKFTINTNNVLSSKPIIGDVASPSQYGVHGVGTQAMADSDQIVAAAIYVYNTIVTSGALTGNKNLTLPAAVDAAGYTKIINNTCTGGFDIIVGDGVGTTVAIADGETMTVLIDSRGATQVGIAQAGATSTAAGSDTQVQFNDGGTLFGGDAGFTYNKTTNVLSLTDAIAFGAIPSTAGDIRMSNNFTFQARDVGNTADVQLMALNATDDLLIGNVTNVNDTTLSALTSVTLATGAGLVVLTDTLLTSSEPLAIGTTPATAGDIRMANAFTLQARDVGNTADVQLMAFNATDDLLLGNITTVVDATLSALTSVTLTTAFGTLTLTDTLLTSTEPLAIGADPATAGDIRMSNAFTFQSRDAGDTADVQLMTFDASDDLLIGNVTTVNDTKLSALTSVELVTAAGSVLLTDTLLTSTEPLATGADPSSTGQVRMPNLTSIRARDTANAADIGLIGLNASDICFVGCTEAGTLAATQVNVYSTATGSVWLGSITTPMMKLDNNANQATLSNVTTVQDGNVNGGVTDVIRSLHTADNTVTNIYTWTIVEDAVTTIDALLTAIADDGTVGASYKRTVTFRESAGVALIGALRDNQTDEDAAAWDVTINDDGAGVGRVRVTGDAALGVTWFVSARIQHTILTP